MKLLRLKITDPKGFRSLPYGFEHYFIRELDLQEELANLGEFAPFICAGRNGSGKSNLLELLSAIFFQLECQYLGNRPDNFDYESQLNPRGFRANYSVPDGFEIEYIIQSPPELKSENKRTRLKISKEVAQYPQWWIWEEDLRCWKRLEALEKDKETSLGRALRRKLLPEYVISYSSGENEIISVPFFKIRFIQFDEYWQILKNQGIYNQKPEARMICLDSSFSQAILLCNYLFQNEDTLQPFQKDIGINSLSEFRIILRRSISLTAAQVETFDSDSDNQQRTLESIIQDHPALSLEKDERGNPSYRLNLLHLLEGDKKSDRIISSLKRCATLSYEDEANDVLILDYWVTPATKQAFRQNFQDFENPENSVRHLFHAFQVLLNLNLYTVGDSIKADLYRSKSHYVSETIPVLPSDQRIMRFKNFYFTKKGAKKPMLLKELSDGEHQLLHSLGLCLLFRNTNSLFLLDEPETHFNPDWRANFISRLRQCFPKDGDASQEMLITTHTPFLISDSKPEKVLVFKKQDGNVTIKTPEYNTLGASINKITMSTFGKRETIGAYAQEILDTLRQRFEQGDENNEELINEIHRNLGDSVEKLLLIKAILASEQGNNEEAEH
ncbi:restriction system-associated AAA family ATPase [Rheinheimera pleomorphica]|uniref:restriction system-associated AAA family ATPase n=1 Tax=Rheinheimera pleomorphica TaxID=2703963 RepID=UPI001421E21B|nr:restriction system-associated AAA family ATPase [Rheinheimera pleomorphica]